ncbi:MAG: DnaD domain protein [Clostridia bacterium]|nr:DnaD domain protein [Clostridia bacterium]
MAFCNFSKEYDSGHTIVDNKFITKYLPEADGFAVKVYLYGLYLCENRETDFSALNMAEALKTTEEQILQAFAFWEDYDLVEILAKEPLTVQYLPVRSAVGRPKKIRYEQYADFNKELQRKMQKVGKFVSAGDYVKYMHFLEENTLQPQALLLIVEYCINKQGEGVSPSYIFNKAKKLIRAGLVTYEQVEKELSNYNQHEGDLLAVFTAMSAYQRTPDESDYELYKKWTENLGFTKDGVLTAARKLKRGTMNGLDMSLTELAEKGKLTTEEIEGYLVNRENLASLVFRLGRKLGVKIQNPAPYIDEYVEKWYNYGFEDSSLLDLALFCMKTERGDFNSLDDLVQSLFADGIVSKEGVKEFLKSKNADLKLFAKLREVCGSIKGNAANLALLTTWREWKFNDEMIFEAAKRSATSSNPIPYMNKILADWKRGGVYEAKDIPENKTTGAGTNSTQNTRGYTNPAIEAINAKSDRERYYALLREKALTRADKYIAKANKNPRFKEISTQLSKMEIALAKAEVFEPKKLPALTEEKAELLKERRSILQTLGIEEEELQPQFTCVKCSDTGFLPSGVACSCYKPN